MVFADGGLRRRHDLLSSVAKKFHRSSGGHSLPTAVADRPTDFSPILLKIRQARPDLVVSNLRQPEINQLPQAIYRVRAVVPGGGLSASTPGRLGRRQGQFSSPASGRGLAPPRRDGQAPRHTGHAFQKIRQAPRTSPGATTTPQVSSASMNRSIADPSNCRRASAQGREVRRMKLARPIVRPYDNPNGLECYAGMEVRQGAAKMKDLWDILRRSRHRARSERDMEASPREGRHCISGDDVYGSLSPPSLPGIEPGSHLLRKKGL